MTIGTSTSFSEHEKEQIGEKTIELMELFEKHQKYLPIILYNRDITFGLSCLFTQKYFQDHLDGMQSATPKYSVEDLDVIRTRFQFQLSHYLNEDIELPFQQYFQPQQ